MKLTRKIITPAEIAEAVEVGVVFNSVKIRNDYEEKGFELIYNTVREKLVTLARLGALTKLGTYPATYIMSMEQKATLLIMDMPAKIGRKRVKPLPTVGEGPIRWGKQALMSGKAGTTCTMMERE